MYVNDNNVTNFNSFGDEYNPKKIQKFIGNENIVTNIYIVQAHDSIMCRYFYIGFIGLLLRGIRFVLS